MNPMVETLMAWTEATRQLMFSQFNRVAKENNLTIPQMGAIMQVHHKLTCGVSDIGEKLFISSAAASQMLERLVQQEFIQRFEDPKDRRVKNLSLTAKGEKILNQVMSSSRKWIEDYVNSLSPDEQSQSLPVLNKMLVKVQELKNVIDLNE